MRLKCYHPTEEGAWSGGRASLWLLRDYVDRGPDGVGVIELIMRLQEQAADAGGTDEAENRCRIGLSDNTRDIK